MKRGDLFAVLDELIETSKDGEDGFHTCADNVKSRELRMFFAEKADRCREGAAELQEIMREMGGDPTRTGTMTGAAHRFWIDLHATLHRMDDHAILAECERGEDVARSVYENALRQALPPDVRRIIERQYREVRANHDHVREMLNVMA